MILTHARVWVSVLAIAACIAAPSVAGDPPKQDPPGKDAPGQSAPSPTPPHDPKFEVDVPKEPVLPGQPREKPAGAPADPQTIRVDDSIDPKAYAIVQRGFQLAGTIKTVEMVTETKLEGVDPATLPPGFGTPHEVALDFFRRDALSLPRMRVSPVSSGGAVVFTNNGTEALIVDNGEKIFRRSKSDWAKMAPFALPALPAWLVSERQAAISAGKKSSEIELRPVMVAARVIGTETIDGTECDVVRVVKNLDLQADDAGHGKPGIVDAMRVIYEIAYARIDGFPRRIVKFDEVPTPKSSRSTTLYSKVRVNPALDPQVFSATPPSDYAAAPIKASAKGK